MKWWEHHIKLLEERQASTSCLHHLETELASVESALSQPAGMPNASIVHGGSD